MNSIDAMESEIRYQLEELPQLSPYRTNRKCLFVGSGDSYAASLAVQYASQFGSLCCHPLDFLTNPAFAYGRTVYIVSVSGRTKNNILAARAAKASSLRTVALTAASDSPLAKSCDEVLQLNFKSSGTKTAGTISFTSSLIACLSLAVKKAKVPKNLETMFGRAEKQAADLARKTNAGKSSFLLGNGILFPIAMYGALKLNEVVGAKAFAYPTDEFCHAPMFSIGKKDSTVVILAQSMEDKRLAKRLVNEGYDCTSVPISDLGSVDALLHSTFFVQLFALYRARGIALEKCHFLKDRRMLRVSSDFIYGC
ncbi:MAG TPA: SIS domain-containing protein [Nitrososphaera sp.]|nr:SIS domain-containing protein [Nitrososphaera sp.]